MSEADREKWNNRYREGAYAQRTHASQFLQDWIGRLDPGRALDVACGAGRNALYLAQHGFDVDAVDISLEALERGRQAAQRAGVVVNWQERDLEAGFKPELEYQLIVVMRYVNLPLIRQLVDSLAPGGFLVCEQHLVTEAEVIGPTNPAYRVQPAELAVVAQGLRICQHEEGLVTDPDNTVAALSRLVAQRV